MQNHQVLSSVLPTVAVLFLRLVQSCSRWTDQPMRDSDKKKKKHSGEDPKTPEKQKHLVGNCFPLALLPALFQLFLFDLTTENPFHFMTPASHWEVDARHHTSMARPAETCSCFPSQDVFLYHVGEAKSQGNMMQGSSSTDGALGVHVLLILMINGKCNFLQLLPFSISPPFALVLKKLLFKSLPWKMSSQKTSMLFRAFFIYTLKLRLTDV